ncbi:MAG: serine/threonine-protein phosphatase [Planctomycetota bacterium]|nr:MAG: serine/threonine-protein phosphatase [Planctomycetota bacterium]
MSAAITQKAEKYALQCMEIWGGNHAVDTAVSVTGIDAWVVSQPYAGSETGGDIHYLSMCGHGRLSRFTVADVSGHGGEVGELASTLRKLMWKNINTLDQTQFVRKLNQEFSHLGQAGKFATALLASYYAPTDHLIVCNAGHLPPLWYQAGTQTWKFLKHDISDRLDNITNLPLGIIEPTDYYQFAVRLEKDDLILIYTDSLIEAQSVSGEQLGQGGLLKLVNQLDVSNTGRLCHLLVDVIAQYRNGAPADDDLTVLLLHHNAADPPQQSIGDMLRVMGKMMGLVKV